MITATQDRGPPRETTGMREAEAAAADLAAGTTRARRSTQGSTAAEGGSTAEGAVMTAGTTKPPPQGRVEFGLAHFFFLSMVFTLRFNL